jgi:hypothetical protein
MGLPATIRAGDSYSWIELPGCDSLGNPITAATWTATLYLRFNKAAEAATIEGAARVDGGWDFAITAATSTGFDAGQWFYQLVATSGTQAVTLRTGSLEVLPALGYTGTATAFDGRSQAQIDLEAVQAAIRAIISKGARQYTIGSRSFTAADLGQLMQRESQLKAIVAREQAADSIAKGLGDPRSLFVRFT